MKYQSAQEAPSIYTIKVKGYVSQNIANNMGLVVKHHEESEQPVSSLSGEVADQAALLGILNNLYGLGFSLMAFENY